VRERPKALDNLVFGLAILLFCVVAYYGLRQIRQRRAAEQAQAQAAAAAADLPLSSSQASASDGLPETGHSGARSFVSGVPSVAADVQRR